MNKIKFYIFVFISALAGQSFASDWVLLHEDPEMIIEWDRGNIHDHDGRKAVRKRISWKKEQQMDNGIRFKFTIELLLYSCKEKTESTIAISNFSTERKLVYKGDIGPIVQRSHSHKNNKDYNDVDRMLKNVCGSN